MRSWAEVVDALGMNVMQWLCEYLQPESYYFDIVNLQNALLGANLHSGAGVVSKASADSSLTSTTVVCMPEAVGCTFSSCMLSSLFC